MGGGPSKLYICTKTESALQSLRVFFAAELYLTKKLTSKRKIEKLFRLMRMFNGSLSIMYLSEMFTNHFIASNINTKKTVKARRHANKMQNLRFGRPEYYY